MNLNKIDTCVCVCPLARLGEYHPKLCQSQQIVQQVLLDELHGLLHCFKGCLASSCAFPLHCTSGGTLGKRQSADTGATDRNSNKMVNFMFFWGPQQSVVKDAYV